MLNTHCQLSVLAKGFAGVCARGGGTNPSVTGVIACMWTQVPALLAAAATFLAGCSVTRSSEDPRSAEEVRISSLPSVASNTVEEFEALPGQVEPPEDLTVRTFPRGTAALRGPHFALGLSWVATGKAIFEGSSLVLIGTLKARRPAEGEELMVLAVDPEYVGGQWKLGDRPKPVAELVIDGTPRALTKAPLRSPEPPGVAGSGLLVVASVAKGAPVRLRVTDLDKVQTLDVLAGKRGADAIAGYYRPTTQKLEFERDLPAGIVVRGVPYPVPLKILDRPMTSFTEPFAMLAPWTPVQGWAPDGRAWLVLPGPVVSAEFSSTSPVLELAIDEPTALRVRLPDGAEVRELGGTRQVSTLTAQTNPAAELIFDVPAGFTTGTYLVDLGTAGIKAHFRDGPLAGRWQPAPPPVEVPLNLAA